MGDQTGSFLIFNVASRCGAVVVPAGLPETVQDFVAGYRGQVFTGPIPLGGNRVCGLAVASFDDAPFQCPVGPQLCFPRPVLTKAVASGAYVWVPESSEQTPLFVHRVAGLALASHCAESTFARQTVGECHWSFDPRSRCSAHVFEVRVWVWRSTGNALDFPGTPGDGNVCSRRSCAGIRGDPVGRGCGCLGVSSEKKRLPTNFSGRHGCGLT